MILKHFLTDVNESNVFVVGCDETREALLVDAGDFTEDMAGFIDGNGLKVKAVFVTHDHYDHTEGLNAAADRYGAEVVSASGRAGGRKGRKVGHGDTVNVGTLSGRVLATPGHTPDSVCLAFPGVVFTGDTLFAGSIGGTSTPDREKANIREHIFSLPPDTEVHTGHGPSSTVSIESRCNPFFL